MTIKGYLMLNFNIHANWYEAGVAGLMSYDEHLVNG